MQLFKDSRGAVRAAVVVVAVLVLGAVGFGVWQLTSKDDKNASEQSTSQQKTASEESSEGNIQELAAGYSELERKSFMEGCVEPNESGVTTSESECGCMFYSISHAMTHDQFKEATGNLDTNGNGNLPAYYTEAQDKAVEACSS
jgi:cytoskeletal protein RodZ